MAKKKPAAPAGAARNRAQGRKGILLDPTIEEHQELRVAAAKAGLPLKNWILAVVLAKARS